MSQVFRLLGASAIAWAVSASPTWAASADPGRSVVTVQAPTLAPGAMGSAPLYGELRPNGTFVLHAASAQTRTGNAMRDTLIRQFVPGTISLSGDAPQRVRQLRNGQTLRMSGTLFVGGSALKVPLFVRMTKNPQGTSLNTFFRLPLSVYGVSRPGGGSAGDVRVGISAVFGP
jgi:hypothetical protein